VELWLLATDMPEQRQGPCLTLAVDGEAKEICRNLDPQEVAYGQYDGQNVQIKSGVRVVLDALQEHLGPMTQSRILETVEAVFTFKRQRSESIDVALSRWSQVLLNARHEGNMQLNPVAVSYLLSHVLKLSPSELLTHLVQLNGRLPQDVAEYNLFVESIRRHAQRQENNQDSRHGNKPGGAYMAWQEDEEEEGDFGGQGEEDDSGYWYGGETYSQYSNDELEDMQEEEHHLGPEDSTWEEYGEDSLDPSEVYLSFLVHRRAARHAMGSSRKGSSKGSKGKGKGKSKKGSFFPQTHYSPSSYKGGKMKGRGGQFGQNPRGADGQVMACHNCGSTSHLRMRCPKGPGKGKGGKDKSSKTYSQGSSEGSSNPFAGYAKNTASAEASSSSSAPLTPFQSSWTTWAWTGFPSGAIEPQLASCEGLLPDTGSMANLMGRDFLERMNQLGAVTDVQRVEPCTLRGIGGAAPAIRHQATVRFVIEAKNADGVTLWLNICYTAQVLEQECVPALLGMASMEKQKSWMDCETGYYHFSHDGNWYELEMRRADTGHMMIPMHFGKDRSAKVDLAMLVHSEAKNEMKVQFREEQATQTIELDACEESSEE